jgi:hypothetical protein
MNRPRTTHIKVATSHLGKTHVLSVNYFTDNDIKKRKNFNLFNS